MDHGSDEHSPISSEIKPGTSVPVHGTNVPGTLVPVRGTPVPGATGQFPGGKLDASDEGEIKIVVSVKDGKVVLTFGKSLSWLGFSPKQARQLAEALRQQSYKAKESQS